MGDHVTTIITQQPTTNNQHLIQTKNKKKKKKKKKKAANLAGARVEDEDGTVDRLGGQVTLKGLVDGDTVDVGVVDKPDDHVGEELGVVLGRQVRLGRLRREQLQRLADPLPKHVQRRVRLHDLHSGWGWCGEGGGRVGGGLDV